MEAPTVPTGVDPIPKTIEPTPTYQAPDPTPEPCIEKPAEVEVKASPVKPAEPKREEPVAPSAPVELSPE